MELSLQENVLFELLKLSIHSENNVVNTCDLSALQWQEIFKIAEGHSILSLLFDDIDNKKNIPDELIKKLNIVSKQTVLQQYHLLFLTRYIIELLKQKGVETVVLKGVGIGSYYPIPELRKSGDIDLLLLNPLQEDIVKEIMIENGFWVSEEQLALHHITFETQSGIGIEVHTLLAEPFDNQKINNYLIKLLRSGECKAENRNVMGIDLPVLTKPYYAFELLLHMLQHFLRSGFGLKLLCDWVVFWQEEITKEDRECYLNLIDEAGIKAFSDVITKTCIQYLGLNAEKVLWMKMAEDSPVDEFMREVLDAEEFGKSGENRMVMMRGTGFMDYVREFHHQMHLNFPKVGKCVLFWPVLWIITFVKFLYNNRKVRNISTKEILKEAQRRSKLMEKIKIL